MEARRYPISIGLIGVMHKEKCKMYMTSVLWSDENEIVVYRTFVDFKKMHKQMKKLFPRESKVKKSDRIIPKFRDHMRNINMQKKGPTKSLLRLKLLQRYCNELLSSDPQVSQCSDLIQFFHPNAEDLKPDFAKNSIMVLPSDEIQAEGAPVPGGSVSKPFVTETYRCVAAYETKDTKNKPFKVALNEQLDVLIKDKAGWWLVENEDKRMAWFPAPYLEKLEEEDDEGDEDDTEESSERGLLCTAVKTYKATKDDEISVAIGSVVEVLQKSDNGWWLIRYNTRAGYIPAMNLQPYNYPHIRMTGHHGARRSSSPTVPTLHLQSKQLNLSPLPTMRSSTPKLTPPRGRRSNSLDMLSEEPQLEAAPPVAAAATATSNPAANAGGNVDPLPTITIARADSEGSFSSNSDYSDDLNNSWASSTSINLSQSYNEQPLRRSITPTPVATSRLHPQSIPEGKMMPSVSDPNLYKGPTAPKVPPRPQAKEILSRCTTVTRKNAAKGREFPTKTEIMGR
ncbi:NADPH oxidase organizer 1a [Spinachia spinachia]